MEEDEANAAAEQLTRALSGGDPPGAIALGGATPLGGVPRVALPLPVSADVAVRRTSTEDEEAAALEAEERLLAAQQAQLDAEAAEEASFQDASATTFQVNQEFRIRNDGDSGSQGRFMRSGLRLHNKDTFCAWPCNMCAEHTSCKPFWCITQKAGRLQLVLQKEAGR